MSFTLQSFVASPPTVQPVASPPQTAAAGKAAVTSPITYVSAPALRNCFIEYFVRMDKEKLTVENWKVLITGESAYVHMRRRKDITTLNIW